VECHETNYRVFLKWLLIVLSHVFFLLLLSSDDEGLELLFYVTVFDDTSASYKFLRPGIAE